MPEPPTGLREVPYNQIVLADCRDLMKRLPDDCVDLIVSSPQLRYAMTQSNGPGSDKYRTYDAALRILQPFLREQTDVLTGCARILKPTGAIFWQVGVFHEHGISIPLDVRIYGILETLGMSPRGRLIVARERAAKYDRFGAVPNLAYSTYLWFSKSPVYTHHPASDAVPRPLGHGEVLMLRSSAVSDEEKTAHPAQDPEEVVARIVASSSHEQDVVFDPYMGSGTTAAVAARLNRRFIGAEVDKNYIDIAMRRLERLLTTRRHEK